MSHRLTMLHWFKGFRWTIKYLKKMRKKGGEKFAKIWFTYFWFTGSFCVKSIFLFQSTYEPDLGETKMVEIEILIYHKKSPWTKIRWNGFRWTKFVWLGGPGQPKYKIYLNPVNQWTMVHLWLMRRSFRDL